MLPLPTEKERSGSVDKHPAVVFGRSGQIGTAQNVDGAIMANGRYAVQRYGHLGCERPRPQRGIEHLNTVKRFPSAEDDFSPQDKYPSIQDCRSNAAPSRIQRRAGLPDIRLGIVHLHRS